jgi:hypothetical protein
MPFISIERIYSISLTVGVGEEWAWCNFEMKEAVGYVQTKERWVALLG